jgi:hypothetical protein
MLASLNVCPEPIAKIWTGLTQKVWLGLGLVDYGRNDWDRLKIQPGGQDKFAFQWCRSDILAQMRGGETPLASHRAYQFILLGCSGVTVLFVRLCVCGSPRRIWRGGLCPFFSCRKGFLYLCQNKKKTKNKQTKIWIDYLFP